MTKSAQRNRPVYPGRFVRLTPHLSSIIAPTSMEHMDLGQERGFAAKSKHESGKTSRSLLESTSVRWR